MIDEISKIYLLRLRELVEKGEFPRHIEDVIARLFAALEKEKARSAELEKRLEDFVEHHKRVMGLPCAKCAEMRAALEYACRFCHGGYIDCNGDKCRQKNCTACYGDDAVGFDSGIIEKAIASDGGTLAEEVKVLRAALEKIRDCDFTITLPDRMDAVRDIARDALLGKP